MKEPFGYYFYYENIKLRLTSSKALPIETNSNPPFKQKPKHLVANRFIIIINGFAHLLHHLIELDQKDKTARLQQINRAQKSALFSE